MNNAAVFPAFLRLQVEETGAFPKLANEARATADQVTRHFRGATDQIQKSLASAMSGSLGSVPDLGTGKFREAAQAAEERARTLRLMSAAANALANDERELSGVAQVMIARIREETQASEEALRTARERASFFDLLQSKMGAATAAGDRFATGQTRVLASAGQLRAGTQQLSYNISDVAGSFAAGISPMMVFAQQGSQVVQALTLMQGEAKGFLGFLGGPWGAAIMGAVTVAGMLGAKYLSMGDEVSKATKELEKSAKQSDATKRAKELFAQTLDGVTEALNRNRESLKQLEDQDETAARRAMESALAAQIRLTAIRNETAGLLEQAKAARERNLQILGGVASPAGKEFAAQNMGPGSPAEERIAAIEASLAKTDAAIAQAGKDLAEATSRRFVEIGQMSPEDHIKRRYDGLIEAARARAVAEGKVTTEIVKQTKALADQRDKEIKALQETQRAVSSSVRTVAFLNPVDGPIRSGFGARAAPKPGASTFHRGVDYAVPTGTPVRAPAVGTVEAVGFDPKLGKYVVINHGAGTKSKYGHLSDTSAARVGAQLAAGEVFARSGNTGLSTRAHLHQSIMQGRRYVDPRKGRFKIDQGAAAFDAEGAVRRQEAETARALADLERDLESVTRAFDPARTAAAEYAEALERIERLVRDHKLSPEDAGRYRYAAAIASLQAEAQAADAARDRLVNQLSDDFRRATEKPIASFGDSATSALIDAGTAGAEAFRDSGIMAAEAVAAAFGRNAGDAIALFSGQYGAFGGKFGRLMSALGGAPSTQAEERIQLPAGGSIPGGPLIVSPSEQLVGDLAKGVHKGMAGLTRALDNLVAKLAGTASSLGIDVGAVGQMLPILAAAAEATSTISNLIGVKDRTGPFGGVLGNVLLDRFIGAKRASSTITFSGGALGASTSGNSGKLRGAANDAADAAMANITRIAEALNATITGTGSVSIGMRDGKYRLDPTGKGVTKTKKGAIDFGEDAAAAVKAATLDLLRDGMLAGMRAGTLQLLQRAKDLDAGLSKALKFEGVFQEIKRRTDPIGAALQDVTRKFQDLRNVFTEAGASAEELAELEKLYGMERKEALEQAGKAMTSTLQGLLDDLKGNNDAFSLRDRLAMARAKYDPLASAVAGGDLSKTDAFAEAARGLEAIIREMEGSQSGYFDFINSAAAITKGALDAQNARITAAELSPGPFSPASGGDSSAPVVGAIDKLGNYLVHELGGRLDGHFRAVNDNLGSLIQQGGARSGERGLYMAGRDNF